MRELMREVEAASRVADGEPASEARKNKIMTTTAVKTWPDARGRFGPYGGRYVPETLVAPLEELERAYAEARADASFARELDELLRNFAGRPTPLQFAGG